MKPSLNLLVKALALTIAALVVSATSACGAKSVARTAGNPTTAASSTAPSPSPSPSAAYPKITVSQDGTAGFDATQVQAAYRALAAYTMNVGWRPTLMRTDAQEATVATLAPVAAMMTPTCAADFDQIATRAAAGSQTDINSVEGITLVGVRSPDTRVLAPGDAAVSDRTVTAASAALDPTNLNRLAITLTATAEVHFVDGTAKSESLTTRHITYDVVPGFGATPWLIDAWQGTIESAPARPEA